MSWLELREIVEPDLIHDGCQCQEATFARDCVLHTAGGDVPFPSAWLSWLEDDVWRDARQAAQAARKGASWLLAVKSSKRDNMNWDIEQAEATASKTRKHANDMQALQVALSEVIVALREHASRGIR